MIYLGVSETHWTKETPKAFEQDGYVIIQSPRLDHIHRDGVAIVIKKEPFKVMSSYDQHSERIISITFEVTKKAKLHIFHVYVPDSSYSDAETETVYETLQSKIDSLPHSSNYMILGDFNAKAGKNSYLMNSETVGRFGLGRRNKREERLLQFCAMNNLVITNTTRLNTIRADLDITDTIIQLIQQKKLNWFSHVL